MSTHTVQSIHSFDVARGRLLLRLSLAGCLLMLASGLGSAVARGSTARTLFKPKSGLYEGPYTSGAHGSLPVKLRVGQHTSTGVEVVNLEQFSAIATCGGGLKRPFARPLQAKRRGKFFSARITALGGAITFSGHFTSKTALTGTVRATSHGPSPSQNCDTGKVSFNAHRVSA